MGESQCQLLALRLKSFVSQAPYRQSAESRTRAFLERLLERSATTNTRVH